MSMSFANNRTMQLWPRLIPVRQQIQNLVGTDMDSPEIFHPAFLTKYDPVMNLHCGLHESWAF